jgi:hypothetical protein
MPKRVIDYEGKGINILGNICNYWPVEALYYSKSLDLPRDCIASQFSQSLSIKTNVAALIKTKHKQKLLMLIIPCIVCIICRICQQMQNNNFTNFVVFVPFCILTLPEDDALASKYVGVSCVLYKIFNFINVNFLVNVTKYDKSQCR